MTSNPKFRILVRSGSTEKEIVTDEFPDEAHAREILVKRGWVVASFGPWTEGPAPPPPPPIPITTAAQLGSGQSFHEIGVISAECVYGQTVFKDIAAGIRNLVGGRAGGMENLLRDARASVMAELAAEASRLRADAVVAVDVRYQTIGGSSGGDMIMAYAVGTAVKIAETR